MKKKQVRVEEAASPYATKKPAAKAAASKASEPKQVRYIDAETARKLTKEILDKHHDLFRKLAQ